MMTIVEGSVTIDEICDTFRGLGASRYPVKVECAVHQIYIQRGGLPYKYMNYDTFRKSIQGRINRHCPQASPKSYKGPAYFERCEYGYYCLIARDIPSWRIMR